jgi:SAM-dependent methyltransferase
VSEPRFDSSIADEQRAWGSTESLDYYRRHRQGVEDLYPSERFFLPEVARQAASMLDVGCAAGGFSALVKTFNPAIRYVGVDVVPAFVNAARADHPGAEFLVGDGVHFATPSGSFELAHASGVLHLNLRFRDIIAAMWQQTSRFLLCDLRLTFATGEIGRMVSPFGEPDGVTLPYIVLNVEEALDLFKRLNPTPRSIRVKGYAQRASEAAKLTNPDILMAFFLVEKAADGVAGDDDTRGVDAQPHVDVDLHVR